MESEDLSSESVGRRRSGEVVPGTPAVSSSVEFVVVGNEICASVAVFMVIESEEVFVWIFLFPSITLVARLPNAEVLQTDKDRLRNVHSERLVAYAPYLHLPLSP